MSSILLNMIYTFLVWPILLTILPFMALLSKKVRQGVSERQLSRHGIRRHLEPCDIWIHASSGEFEYAKPVIRQLLQAQPALRLHVTYFSSSFTQSIESTLGRECMSPLPLDLPGPMKELVNQLQPQVVLISRTDVWPQMLLQLHKKNVPTILFAATFSAGGSSVKRWLKRFTHKNLRRIFTVSPEDEHHFKALFAHQSDGPTIETLGDTRYDQVAFRLQNPKSLPPSLLTWHQDHLKAHTLVMGSTWPEDERIILPQLARLIQNNQLKVILVPHEMGHLDRLYTLLKKLDLKARALSEGNLGEASIVLIDQIGWLAEAYTLGDSAFVGGSFKRSVHSVMEPLGVGLPVFVGPHHNNNREALEFKKLGYVREWTKNNVEQEIRRLMSLQTSASNEWQLMRDSIRSEFNRHLGASARVVEKLNPYLLRCQKGRIRS